VIVSQHGPVSSVCYLFALSSSTSPQLRRTRELEGELLNASRQPPESMTKWMATGVLIVPQGYSTDQQKRLERVAASERNSRLNPSHSPPGRHRPARDRCSDRLISERQTPAVPLLHQLVGLSTGSSPRHILEDEAVYPFVRQPLPTLAGAALDTWLSFAPACVYSIYLKSYGETRVCLFTFWPVQP
jgi:hypothetical protein